MSPLPRIDPSKCTKSAATKQQIAGYAAALHLGIPSNSDECLALKRAAIKLVVANVDSQGRETKAYTFSQEKNAVRFILKGGIYKTATERYGPHQKSMQRTCSAFRIEISKAIYQERIITPCTLHLPVSFIHITYTLHISSLSYTLHTHDICRVSHAHYICLPR